MPENCEVSRVPKGFSFFKEASCLGDKLQENQNIILPAEYVRRKEKWNDVFCLFPNILFYLNSYS